MALSDLDDACQVRLIAADPPLHQQTWVRLQGALDKLFAQFQREGMVSQWGSDLLGDGAVILTAWKAAERLSGCSHDRINRLLLAYEIDGQRLLSTAGLLVERLEGPGYATPRLFQRAELRALAQAGQLDGRSRWWDIQVESLGAWRQHGRKPLVDSPWAARILHNAG